MSFGDLPEVPAAVSSSGYTPTTPTGSPRVGQIGVVMVDRRSDGTTAAGGLSYHDDDDAAHHQFGVGVNALGNLLTQTGGTDPLLHPQQGNAVLDGASGRNSDSNSSSMVIGRGLGVLGIPATLTSSTSARSSPVPPLATALAGSAAGGTSGSVSRTSTAGRREEQQFGDSDNKNDNNGPSPLILATILDQPVPLSPHRPLLNRSRPSSAACSRASSTNNNHQQHHDAKNPLDDAEHDADDDEEEQSGGRISSSNRIANPMLMQHHQPSSHESKYYSSPLSSRTRAALMLLGGDELSDPIAAAANPYTYINTSSAVASAGMRRNMAEVSDSYDHSHNIGHHPLGSSPRPPASSSYPSSDGTAIGDVNGIGGRFPSMRVRFGDTPTSPPQLQFQLPSANGNGSAIVGRGSGFPSAPHPHNPFPNYYVSSNPSSTTSLAVAPTPSHQPSTQPPLPSPMPKPLSGGTVPTPGTAPRSGNSHDDGSGDDDAEATANDARMGSEDEALAVGGAAETTYESPVDVDSTNAGIDSVSASPSSPMNKVTSPINTGASELNRMHVGASAYESLDRQRRDASISASAPPSAGAFMNNSASMATSATVSATAFIGGGGDRFENTGNSPAPSRPPLSGALSPSLGGMGGGGGVAKSLRSTLGGGGLGRLTSQQPVTAGIGIAAVGSGSGPTPIPSTVGAGTTNSTTTIGVPHTNNAADERPRRMSTTNAAGGSLSALMGGSGRINGAPPHRAASNSSVASSTVNSPRNNPAPMNGSFDGNLTNAERTDSSKKKVDDDGTTVTVGDGGLIGINGTASGGEATSTANADNGVEGPNSNESPKHSSDDQLLVAPAQQQLSPQQGQQQQRAGWIRNHTDDYFNGASDVNFYTDTSSSNQLNILQRQQASEMRFANDSIAGGGTRVANGPPPSVGLSNLSLLIHPAGAGGVGSKSPMNRIPNAMGGNSTSYLSASEPPSTADHDITTDSTIVRVVRKSEAKAAENEFKRQERLFEMERQRNNAMCGAGGGGGNDQDALGATVRSASPTSGSIIIGAAGNAVNAIINSAVNTPRGASSSMSGGGHNGGRSSSKKYPMSNSSSAAGGIEMPSTLMPPSTDPLWASARHMYIAYFFAAWGARMWEFAAIVFIMDGLFPSSLMASSIFGLCEAFSGMCSAGPAGSMIDRKDRLVVIRTAICVQNIFIALAMALLGVAIVLGGIELPFEARVGILVGVIAFGMAAKFGSLLDRIVVMKDWLVVIADENRPVLSELNAHIRRIDMLCQIFAPVFVGLASSWLGSVSTCILIGVWSIVSTVVELRLVAGVYRGVANLSLPRNIVSRHIASSHMAVLSSVNSNTTSAANSAAAFSVGNAATAANVSDPSVIVSRSAMTEMATNVHPTTASAASGTNNGTANGVDSLNASQSISVAAAYNSSHGGTAMTNDSMTAQFDEEGGNSIGGLCSCGGVVRRINGSLRRTAHAWSVYRVHPCFWISIPYGLLSISVLSFGGIMVAFLKTQGCEDAVISVGRGFAAFVSVIPTFFVPYYIPRKGLYRTGKMMLWAQVAALAPIVLALLLGLQTVGSSAGHDIEVKLVEEVDKLTGTQILQYAPETMPLLFISIIFISLCASPFGIWGFDLAQTQMMQELVDTAETGRVNGSQELVVNACCLLSFVLTIVFHDPTLFLWPVLISFVTVFIAACLYTFVGLRTGEIRRENRDMSQLYSNTYA